MQRTFAWCLVCGGWALKQRRPGPAGGGAGTAWTLRRRPRSRLTCLLPGLVRVLLPLHVLARFIAVIDIFFVGNFQASFVCMLRAGAEAVRVAEVRRETKETKVLVSINLDGTGVCTANSQIPFLDHMMDVRALQLTA